MAEEKESTSVPLSQSVTDAEDPVKSPPNSPNSSTRKVRFSLFFYLPIFPPKKSDFILFVIFHLLIILLLTDPGFVLGTLYIYWLRHAST